MTRLTARSRANDLMTKALGDLLDDILKAPSRFSERAQLLTALKTQRGFAGIRDDERRLRKRSLSTLTRSADRSYPGKFAELDRRRREAAKALGVKTLADVKESNREDLTERVRMLTEELLVARQDLWHLTSVLHRSMQQSRRYAEKSQTASLIALCRREQDELMSGLSVLKNPAGEVGS